MAVVLVATAITSWLALRGAPNTLGSATAWMAGQVLGMALVLFAVGAGTIWPIVLVAGSAMLAVSVAIAAAAVTLTRPT